MASGRFQSPNDVVREALQYFQSKEAVRQAKLEKLRAEIKIGIDQFDRGESLDFDEVFEEILGLSAGDHNPK